MAKVAVDIGMIVDQEGEDPPLVVPVSDRAKKLFRLLGMAETSTGLIGTFGPEELGDLIPEDYVMQLQDAGPYIGKKFEEITLPASVPVVH